MIKPHDLRLTVSRFTSYGLSFSHKVECGRMNWRDKIVRNVKIQQADRE
jgi:hypothetical protein